MKKAIITFLLSFPVILAFSQQYAYQWVEQAGGKGWDIVTDLTETIDSQLIMVGSFYDTINFQGESLASRGSRDIFIASYTQSGELQRVVSAGGEGYDYVRIVKPSDEPGIIMPVKFYRALEIEGKTYKGELANNYLLSWFDKDLHLTGSELISSSKEFDITAFVTAPDEDFYFTGWFSDTLYMDNKYYQASGTKNIFLGKISKHGKLKWINHFAGTGEDVVNALWTVSKEKNYMAGTTTKGCFGDKFEPEQSPENNYNLFIASFGNQGTPLKVDYPVNGRSLELVDVVSDSTDLWLLLNYRNTLYFPGDQRLVCEGPGNAVLLRYNTETSAVTPFPMSGPGNISAGKLIRSGDQMIVTGSYTGVMYFGDMKMLPSGRYTNVFIATLNMKNDTQELVAFKGSRNNFPCAAHASENHIYIAGEFVDSLKIDYPMVSRGNEDIFLTSLTKCDQGDSLKVLIDPVDNKQAQIWELTANEGYLEYIWEGDSTGKNSWYVTQPGKYLLEVSDSLGCVYSREIFIAVSKSASIGNSLPEEELTGTEREFKVYPTITGDKVYWEPAGTWENSKAVVSVYDQSGRVILSQTINLLNKSQYSVGLEKMTEGIYVLEVAGDGFRETSKVLVKR